MIRLSAIALISVLSTAAFAQQPAPAPTPGQTAIQDAMRADRRACADEVRAKNVQRGERREAMQTCMKARNPDYRARAELGAARRGEVRQVRDACRTEIDPQRLTGPERRDAMAKCIVAKKPEMAKPMACMEQARTKGFKERGERRAFMLTCMKS
ncbi:MAG: hypothetical protein ACRCWF_17055 [Beijerinckiaceae bacterium]